MTHRTDPLPGSIAHRPASITRRVAVLLIGLAIASISACSLPVDDRTEPYNVDDLPPGLTETTTTTTTSTTTTTTVPTESSVADGVVTTSSTTTTLPIRTEPVTVYYTLGSSDEMQPLVIERVGPVSLSAIEQILESPSSDIADFGLRSSVRAGLIDDVRVERAVAAIELNPAILDLMSAPEQRRAIAQIVLTYTSFVTPDQGSIGFVQFFSEGDPYEVFVPATGGSSQPGDVLAFSDFSELISTSITPTTSVTTTTTTTTTTATIDPSTAATTTEL